MRAARRSVAAAVAALVIGCGGGLASHADAVRDPQVRAELREALAELERLRREGWVERVARGECRRTFAAPDGMPPDVIGTLASERETTPAPCREALDALEMLRALRTRLEREEDEPGVLDAFTRAVRGGAPLEHECPRDGDDPVAIVAAVARHVSELSVEWALDVGIDGSASQCRFATLDGVRRVAPQAGGSPRQWVERMLVLRGDVLAPRDRATRRADVEARGTDPPARASLAFSSALDEGWFVPPGSGPHASAPVVEVDVVTAGIGGGSIQAYLVVRASDGWRVIESRLVGQLCQ
ncbi:hypothetical protein [Sandaracinus amylolyticus]|nr:hypothetical protein [Sandaracinus amylolyticus]